MPQNMKTVYLMALRIVVVSKEKVIIKFWLIPIMVMVYGTKRKCLCLELNQGPRVCKTHMITTTPQRHLMNIANIRSDMLQ